MTVILKQLKKNYRDITKKVDQSFDRTVLISRSQWRNKAFIVNQVYIP
jgi:hypothetical protein